jgi:hypothetical protein
VFLVDEPWGLLQRYPDLGQYILGGIICIPCIPWLCVTFKSELQETVLLRGVTEGSQLITGVEFEELLTKFQGKWYSAILRHCAVGSSSQGLRLCPGPQRVGCRVGSIE